MKAKLICGIISDGEESLKESLSLLVNRFGEIKEESETINFNFTDYYTVEMGKNLKRKWVGFEKLIEQENLKDIKKETMKIENEFKREDGTRRVNIDPGYLTLSKLILASTKNYSHRIYLGDGVFAEVTLIYKNREFHPLDWTYPDYKENRKFFESMRDNLPPEENRIIVSRSPAKSHLSVGREIKYPWV